jgi:hypothetical protein
LRKESWLRVFEARVLRRLSIGLKSEEVTGKWRRLTDEEINDPYFSTNIIRVIKSRRMRWVGHVARIGERRGVYRALVGKSEENRPLGRIRRKRKYNIQIDPQKVGWWCVLDCSGQNREGWWALVNAVMNPRVPYNGGNFLPS